MPETLQTKSSFTAGPALLAAVLSLIVYAVCLHGTYVYDDVWIAKNDPRLTTPALWKQYWTRGYFVDGLDNLYRPLVSMSYAVERWLHGDRPWVFHLINWFLHAGVAAAVAELTRRCANRRSAYIAGALFAVHPIHVEAVAQIVGRAELACALPMLGAMILFIRRPLTGGRVAAIFICNIVAILCKEQGLLLPFMLMAMGVLLWRPQGKLELREKSSLRWLVILLCWSTAGYIIGREQFLRFEWERSFLDWIWQPMIQSHGLDRVLMPVVLLGHYMQLMFLPIQLTPDYGAHVIGWHVYFSDPHLWLGALAIVTWCIALIVSILRKMSFVTFCLICMALSYGLIGNWLTLIGVNMAERLVYLPSAFFIILISMLLARLPRPICVTIVVIAVILFGIRTVDYARRWNDRLSFYEYCVKQNPDSSALWALWSNELRDHHDLVGAEAVLNRAAQRMPDCWNLWNELGLLAMNQGRFDNAERYLRRGFDLNIGVALTYNHLAALRAATQAAATQSTRPTTR